jgi:hypothetical protein
MKDNKRWDMRMKVHPNAIKLIDTVLIDPLTVWLRRYPVIMTVRNDAIRI